MPLMSNVRRLKLAMVSMEAEELVGTWGFDRGYRDNPNETRITFAADGHGYVNTEPNPMAFKWSLEPPNLLRISFKEGQSHGPYAVSIIRRQLPLGEFTSLISSGSILPFGLREFQLIEGGGA